ncbi:uncharacterized protein MELLADRAFT_54244 [Melampsora larici-populina 98AG31]|uniref:NFACT RNA-binding domain-containing protein n=1 Tax=Melampsora larici-populina (strain 98AG31 / pathotype 3-4-7) TaxID=747676 RepID=F4SAX1_MELLP|nr:uncharacterized protein MELLADRAFT_54244 [Melampsora larici-populina 98AG31]EGF98210.1 hypothetical protein MELLADRAFT_54244 [Melampsora larici-populina 98AG31]
MVLFFTSNVVDPTNPVTLYMGKDKHENEYLIKHAWPEDVWFHVDKLSSAHVYIRLPNTMSDMNAIPEALLQDCAQLVKANSIEGNKRDNLTIIFTPASNLKKTGDMAIGQVSFHSDKLVKRVHIATRLNPIVNRLNKTKVERVVDFEVENLERQKALSQKKKEIAIEKAKADLQLQAQRKAEREARSYEALLNRIESQEHQDKGEKVEGFDSDEDFM